MRGLVRGSTGSTYKKKSFRAGLHLGVDTLANSLQFSPHIPNPTLEELAGLD